MKKIIAIILIGILCQPASFSQSNSSQPKDKAIYVINVLDEQKPDSLILFYYNGSGILNRPDRKYSAKKDQTGHYTFEVEKVNRFFYISLFFKNTGNGYPKFLMQNYLCEPGDNVAINMRADSNLVEPGHGMINYPYYHPYNRPIKTPSGVEYKAHFEFSGKGSEKFNCRYEGDKTIMKRIHRIRIVDGKGNFIVNQPDSAKLIALNTIEKYKSELSPDVYQILKADANAYFELERIALFKNYYASTHKKSATNYYQNVYNSYLAMVQDSRLSVSSNAKTLSFSYATYMGWYYYYFLAGVFSPNHNLRDRIKIVYDSLKTIYSGELRDKILTTYLALAYENSSFELENAVLAIEDAKSIIKTLYCLDLLSELAKAKSKGSVAYNFILPDSENRIRKLSDFAGKVVFIDFWFTGCKPCIEYYHNTVSPTEDFFEHNKEVVFITISMDGDKNIWKQSINSGIYTSSKAINLFTEGKGYNHPVSKSYKVNGCPRPVLIGRDGRIYSASSTDLKIGGAEGLQKKILEALVNK